MKILFVTHYALPHVGGVEVVVDRLARELRGRGHDVEQIAARPPKGVAEQAAVAPGGALVHHPRAWNVIEARTGLPYPLFGPGLARLARRHVAAVDVVHAHGFLFVSSAVVLASASRRARRYARPARVLSEHGGRGVYESRPLRALESVAIHSLGAISLRSTQAVVALNPRIADLVRRLRPGVEVVDIPNGVDSALYRPASAPEREALRSSLGWDDRPRALFVGRLVARKGADLAVEATRDAPEDVQLVLAGPGQAGELPDNALALGELPAERVAELYRAADCFLLPSAGEGFPLTAQEALASGLPIVLADDPAYAPYLDGAPEGVVRVPRTSGALSDALRRIRFGRAFDADQRERLVEFARSRFSWARSAERHEALYAELTHTGRLG